MHTCPDYFAAHLNHISVLDLFQHCCKKQFWARWAGHSFCLHNILSSSVSKEKLNFIHVKRISWNIHVSLTKSPKYSCLKLDLLLSTKGFQKKGFNVFTLPHTYLLLNTHLVQYFWWQVWLPLICCAKMYFKKNLMVNVSLCQNKQNDCIWCLINYVWVWGISISKVTDEISNVSYKQHIMNLRGKFYCTFLVVVPVPVFVMVSSKHGSLVNPTL